MPMSVPKAILSRSIIGDISSVQPVDSDTSKQQERQSSVHQRPIRSGFDFLPVLAGSAPEEILPITRRGSSHAIPPIPGTLAYRTATETGAGHARTSAASVFGQRSGRYGPGQLTSKRLATTGARTHEFTSPSGIVRPRRQLRPGLRWFSR